MQSLSKLDNSFLKSTLESIQASIIDNNNINKTVGNLTIINILFADNKYKKSGALIYRSQRFDDKYNSQYWQRWARRSGF